MMSLEGYTNGLLVINITRMKKMKIPVVELGDGSFQVSVDLNLYAPESITATSYKYTDRFYIHQQTSSDNKMIVNVIFEAKNDSILVSDNVVKSFCNDLIDQQVRFFVNQNFGHIRDLIVEEAFKPVNN